MSTLGQLIALQIIAVQQDQAVAGSAAARSRASAPRKGSLADPTTLEALQKNMDNAFLISSEARALWSSLGRDDPLQRELALMTSIASAQANRTAFVYEAAAMGVTDRHVEPPTGDEAQLIAEMPDWIDDVKAKLAARPPALKAVWSKP